MLYLTYMITPELVSYIKKQIENNIQKDLIISKLVGASWHQDDVEEGFASIESELKPEIFVPETKNEVIIETTPETKKDTFVDKYHEPIEGDNLFEVEKVVHKEEAPVLETPKTEISKIETPIVETPKTETPKVWIPTSVPVKEKTFIDAVNADRKVETTQLEVQNIELPTEKRNQLPQQPIKLKSPEKMEEMLPTLILKKVIETPSSFIHTNKTNFVKPLTTPVPTPTPIQPPQKTIDNLAKIAMLSSYSKDLMSVNKAREEIVKQKNHKITKWLFFIVPIIILIALVAWAYTSGYINLKKINLSFIKKDPKVLLLKNSEVLSSLKSYKTETNVEISSPSFANITYGLLSGEAVESQDKDTFSVNTLGIIERNEKGIFSDNFVTIKSSLIQDYITTDIKNDGTNLFVSVPDLSDILKENVVDPAVVKINESQLGMIPSLFSSDMETQLNKINIYKIISSGMPSYINNDTLGAYNELVNNVEIIEKGQENIKGVDTYHYSINVDRQLAKNLLNKISDNIVLNLSDTDKEGLAQILGAVTIDLFDVWIGKGDNNIYQYNVVLDIPLSKLIGFDDKSIGDNKVSVNWKTTYYDFGISNNIFMPDSSISAIDFIKDIKIAKIKNDVSSFKQLAENMFKVEKAYGKISNIKGDCLNPVSGSLFSPTGHTKGSVEAVSTISLLINKILNITGNVGYCYSSPKAWSLTVPISDDLNLSSLPEGGYKSFYCIDNTGTTKDLTTAPKGVVCE